MDEKLEEKTLEQLFKERDESYHNCTQAIVAKIDFVFEAVLEALEINLTTVSWEGIDIHEGMLVIVGKLNTSSAIPEKIRILTVGIPVQIINSKSKDFIVKFLKSNNIQDQTNTDNTTAITEMNKADPATVVRPVAMSLNGETATDYLQRSNTNKRTLH